MKLRAKSLRRQGMVWFFAALAFLALYVVLSHCLYGTVRWNPFDYRSHRLMLPLAVLFALVAWETRWDGVVREGKKGEENVRCKCPAERHSVPVAQPGKKDDRHCTPTPVTDTASLPPPRTSAPALSGEELYVRARTLPHQPIPDFNRDGEYLDLLGKSAATGYAPALVKLGEYAMCRAAWVEAYHWMRKAQRNGMHGLSPVLREIRNNWARDGFPDQISNVNAVFTQECGALGRALLCVDSGRAAAKAREYLKAHHPEFVV